MNRLLRSLSLALVVMLVGCTAMMESSSYGSNDLYITNNRERVIEELTARAEFQNALMNSYYSAPSQGYASVLAGDYESAYARRLYGFNSPTYRLPASYYNLATSDAMRYASAYDPAFYNVMVSGDQVWVEPKYVTSMFGTWGATNVTFGIHASPWVYGWGGYVSPFYYTMWGYPHYSWYDWNWNMCYGPYHYGFGYYPHYHPAYPPHHRPGKGDKNYSQERRNASSRFTSPASTQSRSSNLNGSRVGSSVRSGATSSGINQSRVNGGSSRGSVRSSVTERSTTNSSRDFRGSSSRSTVSNSSSSTSNRSSSSSIRSIESSNSTLRSSGGVSRSGSSSLRR